MGLLLAGLADADALVPMAAGDDLATPPRTRSALYPEAPQLLGALRDGGATVSCWSGAGPEHSRQLHDAKRRLPASACAARAEAPLERVELPGRASDGFAPSRVGLVVSED